MGLEFALAVLSSPSKSKLRPSENALLRHQSNVVRSRLHGRIAIAASRLAARSRSSRFAPQNIDHNSTLGRSFEFVL
jgi:hypothetical protein